MMDKDNPSRRNGLERSKPWLDTLSNVRLLVILSQMRPILRPSARRDLCRFIVELDSKDDLEELIRWAGVVFTADFEERLNVLWRPKTRKAILLTRLDIFRRPERAFK